MNTGDKDVSGFVRVLDNGTVTTIPARELARGMVQA